MFDFWLWTLLLFVIPVATIVFFGISLYWYISGRRRSKREPGSISPQNMGIRGVLLGISAALMAILLLVLLCIIALVSGAIAFM